MAADVAGLAVYDIVDRLYEFSMLAEREDGAIGWSAHPGPMPYSTLIHRVANAATRSTETMIDRAIACINRLTDEHAEIIHVHDRPGFSFLARKRDENGNITYEWEVEPSPKPAEQRLRAA